MSITQRAAQCPPEAVFDVLQDGWLYASWVVGASHIRDVEPGWPEKGSHVHHAVGSWPMLIKDTTEVLAYEPPRLLKLQARAWPAGEATVTITVDATPSGCMITIEEAATKGPAAVIPQALLDPMLNARNKETLDRLATMAEGRAG